MYNSADGTHAHWDLITLDGSIIIIIFVEYLERIIKTLIQSYLAFHLKP